MDKCPKCGEHTLVIDRFGKRRVCVNASCDYSEPADMAEYNRKHNILLLVKPAM